jgi:hypothetical protein
LAQTVVLEGESKERFEQLHAGLLAEFQPRTPSETALVETMAIARWRYLRVLGVQKAGFDLEMARQPAASPIHRAAAAFKHLADNSRVLDLFHRYETSYDRQFTRALNALLKLRAAAPSQPSALDDSPSLTPVTSAAEVEAATRADDAPPAAAPEPVVSSVQQPAAINSNLRSEPNPEIEHQSASVPPVQVPLTPPHQKTRDENV